MIKILKKEGNELIVLEGGKVYNTTIDAANPEVKAAVEKEFNQAGKAKKPSKKSKQGNTSKSTVKGKKEKKESKPTKKE